ncbi:MAG: tyrosine--tRNA ligase [Acidiphilium sp. 37-64-53]|uniref:tyrosine--tRNA ligase n=1 Tax=Acidiphilium TaxID=522 RepID=UPI000BC3ACB4|nr:MULTISPECIES: tyrosine--tRNA ligase [Acidiphilium]OYW01474.1 MAG: tyrosine--tRNA ligase [Acidiphilium sp. 37-64-53]OZB30966.1 MAG: tyrosine--tRNA ligase [Acidiphilium sp. 34-64-41]HQT83918.1 tyrosine--tRNA ligase [Acidiphilium rubrum]
MTDGSDFLREAEARGFIFQCTDTDGLRDAMRAAPVAGYIGFDCTADGLHVGSLVQIMLLRLLQRHGHKPIALMGGGTSRIGDPSGRDSERQMLTDDDIARNMAGIRANLEAFINFGTDAGDALQLNNADWLEKLGYIEVLRDVGPHFSINRMMTMDSVKARLDREAPFSFLEFNYAILQGYDFRELNRRYGVTLQMGGSDQWGNIVQGMELVRRTDGKATFGLTTPLIATASGVKMGKTAAGAVWLSAEKRSPFDYWQFWRNTEDADVGRFLRLFTDLPLDEIARLESLGGAEINEAKKILATAATSLCHGADAAAAAAETARRTFEAGEAADDLPGIDIPRAELGAGVPAIVLLVRAGLATSNGEARRLIRGGGARLNDAPITDEAQTISLTDLIDGVAKLSAGKKQHRLVRAG